MYQPELAELKEDHALSDEDKEYTQTVSNLRLSTGFKTM
jgi:hypothetical protein